MNSLFVYTSEFSDDCGHIQIAPQRVQSVLERHDLQEGVTLSVAIEARGLGKACVRQISRESITLDLVPMKLNPPPAREPISLLVAVSRPQTVRKVLQGGASMGMREILLVQTDHVVPSYLQSHALRHDAIEQELLKGVEQGCDATFPRVRICRSLSSALEELAAGDAWELTSRIVADTSAAPVDSSAELRIQPESDSYVVAVGPETGWSQREISALAESRFERLSLGPRILRVEVAMMVLVGRIQERRYCGRFLTRTNR